MGDRPLHKVRNHRPVRPAFAPHEAPQRRAFYTVLVAVGAVSLVLTVLGNLSASSIQVDTLTIGSTGATAVPEPTTLALLGEGAVALLGYVWRRWRPA